ncbi:MAG: hypothetical protein D6800_00335 [Candidatus Zixiibacteriota bacterium]|nr:MAG: hypothetical protein D6800_00335 [candidate division Zixibacteria bacterium]
MSTVEILQIWVMAFFTLAIFSFLYKDNPVYKFAEHIFAGLSAGYYVGLIWKSVIIQQLWVPVTRNGEWWLIIPGLLGCLMFARFWPRWSWLSRIALAFVMGNTAGVFIVSQLHGNVLPQMRSTMQLQPLGAPVDVILTAIVVVGVVSTLIYFYFSHEHKGVLGVTAKVGIWSIMIAFGAHFGYTVMARLSLLIGRVQFLVDDWIGSFRHIF